MSDAMNKLVGLALLGQIHEAQMYGCDVTWCIVGRRDEEHEEGCPMRGVSS